MKTQLLALVAALDVLSAFGTPTIVPENYTAADDITITVTGSESLASSTLDGHTGKVTKDGTGVLTFTGDGGTFAGTFVVKSGAVKARAYAFASGMAVTVESGATWDIAGGGETWKGTTPKIFTIAGTGDTANGYSAALVRSSGTAIRSGGTVTLSADATIEADINHNFGSISLQNHKLTKRGTGNWDAYGGLSFTTGGDNAAIEIMAGSINLQAGYPFSGGNSSNVLTLHEGVSLIQYPQWGPTFNWKLNVAGNATLYTASARSGGTSWPTWAGPVELTGGNLKIDTKSADYQFSITGNVTAKGGYGIVGVQPGAGVFQGAVAVTNIVNTKRGTLTFTNDVTLAAFTNAVGKSDADACGKIVFKGNVTQTDESVVSKNDRGTVRFEGSERVEILGPLGASNDKGDTYGTQPTGAYEVVNVKYFRHPNTTRLSGTFANPQILMVSNSVWDCGNGEVVVGNNFSHGRAQFLDSTLTNKLTIGGYQFDNWASRGAVQISGSRARVGGIRLGNGNGSYGFLETSDSVVTVDSSSDMQLTLKGIGFWYAKKTVVTLLSSLKFAQSSAATACGIFYLTGGTTVKCYQFVPGNGILALEGTGTQITTENGLLPLLDAGTLVTALNDGAGVNGRVYRYSGAEQDHPWHLAVNGGVLHPTWTQTGDFFNTADQAPTTFVIGSEGVIVSTDSTTGYRSTFCVPMTAPTGKVVASVALPEEVTEATYFGPAKIVISGTGSGAAAIALYDFETRRITGVKIVAGGTGYDDATTATIASPDGTSTYACTVTTADAPTTGRGLVKRGPAVLKLTQANTYRGPTTVEEGTLEIAAALPAGSELIITNGATATCIGARTFDAITGAAGTLSGDAATTGTLKLIAGQTLTVAAGSSLHLADGATIAVDADINALDKDRSYPLVAGSVVRDGAVTLPALPSPWAVRVRSSGVTIGYEHGLVVLVR